MDRISLIALLLVAAQSCSLVLEDRQECPAFVFFQREDGSEPGDFDRVWVKVTDGETLEELSADDPLLEKMCSESYSLEIPKREEIMTFGITGARVSTLQGTELILPPGYQGDPIYRFWKKDRLTGEEFHVPLRFIKEFCRMTVVFKHDKDPFPYDVVVSANTCGMDISTGVPIQGPFRYSPPAAEPGVFRFTVPRQGDYTLTLELWKPADSTTGKAEEHAEDLVLWNALQSIKGFSWAMENLPDLTLEIDYVRASVTVLINDWDISSSTDYLL